MSLFSSIQLASNALKAAQIGLQVTGNNIANANTPGYLRADLVLVPAPTQRVGGLLLGMGVDIAGVVQNSDAFLERRLRQAIADLSDGETREDAYFQLEQVIGELSDTDLSSSINNFIGSIHDILNQPENVSVRNLAVLQGNTLAGDIRRMAGRARQVRKDLNEQIIGTVTDINRRLSEVSKLNTQIVIAENGGLSKSDAVGLRDQRKMALDDLASIIGSTAVEQTNGSVTVFAGSDFLVFEGMYREVEASITPSEGIGIAEVVVAATQKAVDSPSGELAGLLAARDDIFGGFIDQLDDYAQTLAFEFNKVYANGQGLKGHDTLTSEFVVSDVAAALDQVGLANRPVNGSLQVKVFNTRSKLTETTDVFVHLNGLEDDTTLEDLRDAIDAIDGISASITTTRRLTITSDSSETEFGFANDTSGVLAALGLNTFFTGSTATDIAVSQVIRDDPAKFAASQSGIGRDTENAVAMAAFLDKPLESHNGETITVVYDRMTGEVTQGGAVAGSVAEAFRVFQRTLEGQQMAMSGVNLDEEAIKLITYQRAYQASARYIARLNELLEILVNL